MAQLEIVRSKGHWSRWNSARLAVDAALERADLPTTDTSRWREDGERTLVFTGSEHECRAVAVALEGLGLEAVIIRNV
jgi:hypothetical protein